MKMGNTSERQFYSRFRWKLDSAVRDWKNEMKFSIKPFSERQLNETGWPAESNAFFRTREANAVTLRKVYLTPGV